MPDTTLAALSPLDSVAHPGRHGRPSGAPGVILSERIGLGLATVIVRRGQGKALAASVKAIYGVDLPTSSRAVSGPEVTFIGTGPGQWFAVSEALKAEALAADLSAKLKGLASIFDQCDGRAVIRVAGPRARDVFAKGLPIDLDPSAFGPGAAAVSVISYMGVQLWQVDDRPTFDLAVFRSLSGSFWHWLVDSAAEFGVLVEPARG